MNPHTSSIAIHACALIADLSVGRKIHTIIVKSGHNTNLPVANALIDMYCKCSCISEAKQYFNQMTQRDLITWNTMIAGLDRFGSHEALDLLRKMCLQFIQPNCFTFTSIISACARLPLLNCGRQVHAAVIRRGFAQNQQIANALVNMYTKCSSIVDSVKIFDEMAQKDLISYTTLMIGYGFNGYGIEAIQLFEQMTSIGILPDSIVFIGLLSACSHAGLVDEGLKYFNLMNTKYKVQPDMEVYGCIVDLLGRAGRVKEAYELIVSMPFEADEPIWGALLGACKVHGNIKLGRLAARRILDLKPEEAKTYVMLSNVLASEHEWGEAREMRRLLKGSGGRKAAGRSWIELKEGVCSFIAGDRDGSACVSSAHEALEMLAQHMDGKFPLIDLESLT